MRSAVLGSCLAYAAQQIRRFQSATVFPERGKRFLPAKVFDSFKHRHVQPQSSERAKQKCVVPTSKERLRQQSSLANGRMPGLPIPGNVLKMRVLREGQGRG